MKWFGLAPVVQAEHETGTAGGADDALRVRTIEDDAFLGESVEIRRDRRLVAIAAESRGQIIRHDEEDVGPAQGFGGGDSESQQ